MATKNISATITIGGTLTSGLKTALGGTKKALQDIGSEISRLKKLNKDIGTDIRVFDKLGRNVEGLRQKYADTVKTIDQLRVAQKRLADAQATRERLGARAGSMARVGAGASVAGGAMLGAMVPGIQEAKRMQAQMAKIAALGFSEGDTKHLEEAALGQKAFGVSQEAAAETARDLASAFGDVHHAISALPLALSQRAALKLYDSEHGSNLAENAAYSMGKVIELRNGTQSPEEYAKQANMAHQVLVATGGRVNGEGLQEAIKRGGIAMKGMSDEAFYYGGSHFMQEMGGDAFGTASMSLYQALAQGKMTKRAANNLENFGLIGDRSKVTEDKAGQVKFLDPGALIGYSTFAKDPQAWVEQYFIPALKKHGIDPDDMEKVAEVSGSIISNRTGANLLATRVAQRKVVEKEAANAARADNIQQGLARTRETAAGKEMDAEAKLANAKLNLGNNILPLYTRALEAASDALVKFNKFTEDHPKLSNALVIGITAVGGALVVLGPVLIAAGGLLNAYAAMQLRAAAATTATTEAMVAQNAAAGGGGMLGKAGKFAGKAFGAFAAAELGLAAAKAAGLPDVTDETQKQGEQELRDGKYLAASAHMSAGSFLKGLFTGAPNATPNVPPMAGSSGTMPAPQQNNTFQITQLPGESGDDLAQRIIEKMKKQNSVVQRGTLLDGVSN